MLHIILFILKCIGWLLLAILGILLLMVVLVLFLPFRYKGNASCEGDFDSVKADMKFSWFFHLLAGKINVENRQVNWSIRIAWKKITSGDEQEEEVEEAVHDVVQEAVHETKEVIVEETLPAKQVSEKKQAAEQKQVTEQKQIAAKEPVGTEENFNTKTSPHDKQTKQKDSSKEEQPQKRRRSLSEMWEAIRQAVLGFFEKIKYTFHKFCATIKAMLKKKDILLAFIEDETHKAAFFAAWKELRRLLKFAKPKHFKAEVTFGFEDPTNTGLVLAAASMIYPFLGEYTVINPDFEQAILEGDVRIDGKLRAVYLIILCWNLFWNKEVRTTYKHFRKFKW